MKTISKYFLIMMILISVFTGRKLMAQEVTKIDLSPKPEFPQFKSIELTGMVSVILEKGESQSVWVNYHKENVEDFNINVENGVLFVSSSSKFNGKDKAIHIVYTKLSEIEISGVSSVTSSGPIVDENFKLEATGASEINIELEVSNLTTSISGACKVTLKGTATQHNAEISGAAILKADELLTQNAEIDVSGVSKIYLLVKQELNGEISGMSKLILKEEPLVKNIEKSGEATYQFRSHEYKDSVTVKIGKMDIKVFEDDDSVKVTLGKMKITVDEDGNVKIDKEKKDNKFKGHWTGVDLGINGYVNSDNTLEIPAEYEYLELNMNKSWVISLNFLKQSINLARQHFGLVTGMGLQFNNYRFNNDVILSGDSAMIYGNHNGLDYNKSKLVVNYLNIPLLLEYNTRGNQKFHVAAGGIFGIRLGSHTKRLVFEDDDRRRPKEVDDFHLNPFRYDVTFRIGWGEVNVFANYSLSTLFQKNKGPELYPFAVGISWAD